MFRQSFRSLFCPAVFFLLLLGVFFPTLFFLDRIFLARMGDLHLINYSWMAYFDQMMRQGIWPLWNPLVNCGYPYGSGAVSHVSLANLLVFLVKDAPTAWNIQILANVFLAAFGTFLYMRKMGISIWGALIAGTLFAFLPGSASYGDSWPFFIPIALWLLEEFYASRRRFLLVLLVFNFWVMILNALPQYTLYAGILFSIYALVSFRSLSGIYILIFAIGLAAFHLFRLFELLPLSPRGKMWFVSVLLPTNLVNMIFPFLYESPFRPESNFFFHKILGAIAQRCYQLPKVECLYPPYLTVAGFSFALFAWRLKGPLRFFWAVAAGILAYLITFPLLLPLYRQIPVLAQLPRVGRLFPVLTFCFSVLAGWGADRILKKEFRLRPIAFFYGGLCGILFAGLGIVRLIAHLFQAPLREFMTNFVQTHIVGQAAYRAPESFYLERINQFFSFIDAWTRWNDPSILVPVILITGFLLLLTAWRHDKLRKNFFAGAILFLIVADILFVFRTAQNSTASRSEIAASSPAIQFLRQQPGIFRVTTVLEEAAVGVGRERDILAPNLNLQFGLSGIEGYDPLFSSRYSDFIKNFQGDPELDPAMTLSGPESGFDYRMMDFLNVRYFFTKKAVRLQKDLPLAFEDARNKVYGNPLCQPRAFLVTDYRILSGKDAILTALRDPAFDFRKSVILEDKPLFPAKKSASMFDPHAVIFERYEPDHIKMKIRAATGSIMVLSDNDYPGWKAFLDGRETRILRANYTFRAIEIPQGEHTVEFHFWPMSYRRGLAISLVFLITGLVFLMKMPGCVRPR